MRITASPRAAAEPVPNLSNSAFARYAWAVLIYNLAVVMWGAFVRVTGSGAGCGNDWPRCNGQITPHSPAIETVIEFTHRSTSGIDVVLVALLVGWAFRVFPRRHPARPAAVLSAVFLVIEALIGAALVLLDRVVKNASAWWQTAHLLNTLTLLACLALAAWWGMGKPSVRFQGLAARITAATVAVFGLVGVSGVIAALGDTLSPALSLAQGLSQDLDPASGALLRMRVLHPAIAAGAAVWFLYYASRTGNRYSRIMAALAVAQVLAGIVNLVLLAPAWMQLVHLFLADLLWLAFVLTAAVANAVTGPSRCSG